MRSPTKQLPELEVARSEDVLQGTADIILAQTGERREQIVETQTGEVRSHLAERQTLQQRITGLVHEVRRASGRRSR